jgi:hypothetical protein
MPPAARAAPADGFLSHIDLLQRQRLHGSAAVVGRWFGLLFVYLLPVDCVVIWSSSHCQLL